MRLDSQSARGQAGKAHELTCIANVGGERRWRGFRAKGRNNWKLAKFVADNHLGTPVAVNFYGTSRSRACTLPSPTKVARWRGRARRPRAVKAVYLSGHSCASTASSSLPVAVPVCWPPVSFPLLHMAFGSGNGRSLGQSWNRCRASERVVADMKGPCVLFAATAGGRDARGPRMFGGRAAAPAHPHESMPFGDRERTRQSRQ